MIYFAFFALFMMLCSAKQPNQQTITSTKIDGQTLWKYFPKNRIGSTLIPTQEKKGFMSAHLKPVQPGIVKATAIVSIADMQGEPIHGFTNQRTVKGFPSKIFGSKTVKLLVGNRFIITIQSQSPTFTIDSMYSYLESFDLGGLNALAIPPLTSNKPQLHGQTLWQYFPKNVPGVSIVPTQEKVGFMSAHMKQNNQVIATISIADMVNEAQSGYSTSEVVGSQIVAGGFPFKRMGKTIVKALIANRFVVSVQTSSFDGKGVLEMFDLGGLKAAGQ